MTSIRQCLKSYINQLKEKRRQRIKSEIDAMEVYIKKPLSPQEISDYNTEVIGLSAGWMGGNYTERDIKFSELRGKSQLFTNNGYCEKYLELYSYIEKEL